MQALLQKSDRSPVTRRHLLEIQDHWTVADRLARRAAGRRRYTELVHLVLAVSAAEVCAVTASK